MDVALSLVCGFAALICVVRAVYEVKDERKVPLKMGLCFVLFACGMLLFIA